MLRSMCALVADSQEIFCGAMQDILQRRLNFTEVAAVTRFETATRILSSDQAISLAIIDLSMPDMDGLASMASLRVAYPNLRLAALAGDSGREAILRALSLGIHGFLPRTLSTDAMVQALTGIMSGQIYVPPTLSDVNDELSPQSVAHLTALHNGKGGERHEVVLTARQQEVIQLIRDGLTNKEIGRSLNLAEGTVKAHVNAVFRALSVHNRASVAAMLSQHLDKEEER